MPVEANLQKILIRHKPSFPPLGKYPVVRSLLCLDGILIYYSVIRSEAFQRIRFGLNADKRNALIFVLMRVHERNVSSCRKIVDTDFRSCERMLCIQR